MKTTIIIGATSGIGKGLAEKLVENNWKIGITGRRTKLLNEIKSYSVNQIENKVIQTNVNGIRKVYEFVFSKDGV